MAQITDVLRKLLDQTEQNNVPWQPSTDEQAFIAIYGNASIVILLDGARDPVLRILDKSGNVIESLDGGFGEGLHWRDDLGGLHLAARRHALGVDQTLSKLLDEIGAEDVDGLSS